MRGDLLAGVPGTDAARPSADGDAASLALGEHLSPIAIAGLTVASLATVVFALPEKNFGGSRKARNSAFLLGDGDRGGAAIYNVIDAQGVRSGPSQWSFIVWLFVLDWIGINTIAFFTRGRTAFIAAARAALWPGISPGICSLISFSMALHGFSIAPVAYISAMRETAVVFAAIMGWWFLREGLRIGDTLAALVLATGLGLLQFG